MKATRREPVEEWLVTAPLPERPEQATRSVTRPEQVVMKATRPEPAAKSLPHNLNQFS
jgi:hypothetical protein